MTTSQDPNLTAEEPHGTFRLASAGELASDIGNLAKAVEQLRQAEVPDSQEPERRQILEFCQQHPDALHRSCLKAHLTASTFVVDQTTTSIALIHHRKLDRWLQPGGHADGEGNLLLVAATEVAEEVGLDGLSFVLPAFDIDVHRIPVRGEVPEHLHLDLRFLAVVSNTPRLHGNDETNDAAWVGLDDPRIHDGESVADAANRALRLVAGLGTTDAVVKAAR